MRSSLLLLALCLPFSTANSQNVSLPATFGDIALGTGFLPDPYVINVVAGGNIDAAQQDISCVGYVSDAPDFRLNITSASDSLLFLVLSEEDTSLVVNTPSGDWLCDDDSGGSLNPLLQFSSGVSGVFDIWVGSLAEETNPAATLLISELSSTSLLTSADLDSMVESDFSSNVPEQASSNFSAQSETNDYTNANETLSPDEIAQCSMDIQNAQVNSGSDTASIVDLYTYQIALFEGECAGHPEADAYISNGRRFLARELGVDVDSLPTQNSTSSSSSTVTNRDYGDRSRVIASDGESAMDCTEIVDLASGDSSTSGGNRVIRNNCGEVIEIVWCYVGEGLDGCGAGGQWTLRVGGSWPVSVEKEIRWAACRGRNTVGFEDGSAGLRYICSAPL